MFPSLSDRLTNAIKFVEKTPYSLVEPLSYVALIPVVSIIVKELKFGNYEKHLYEDDFRLSLLFEKTCKAHFQGAIVQVVALTILFPGVGSSLAIIAAADAVRTAYRAYKLSDKTPFLDIPEDINRGYKFRMAHLIGW